MLNKMLLDKVPTRLSTALMIFTSTVVNYTMRTNLSVNIVSMVPIPREGNLTLPANYSESLGWSAFERGSVLSSYYWGYIVANLCSGPIAERFGPRLILLVTTLVSAGLTLASPATAKFSYIAMLVLRVSLGFCGGFQGTSSHVLISRWAVRCEKGKFVALLVAGTGGTVLTWSLCGVIISAFGWEWAFYTFGITALVWCALAWYLLYDTPQKHPRISNAEKQYIIDGIPDVSEQKAKAPYLQALTSVPMWAVVIGMFGTGWGSFFVINAVPMFISNVFQFNPEATGLLSSIPYITKFIFSFCFGFLADFLLKRKLLSVRVLRKSFTCISHLIPACMLVVITLTDDATIALAVMAFSMAMHGAMVATTAGNAQDLAPNFAGTVFGFVNAGGSVAGILTPLVVAYFTKDHETMFEAWRPVFYTGASVYAVTAIIFILFGSTEIQPWNYIGPGENEKVKRFKDEKTVEM